MGNENKNIPSSLASSSLWHTFYTNVTFVPEPPNVGCRNNNHCTLLLLSYKHMNKMPNICSHTYLHTEHRKYRYMFVGILTRPNVQVDVAHILYTVQHIQNENGLHAVRQEEREAGWQLVVYSQRRLLSYVVTTL